MLIGLLLAALVALAWSLACGVRPAMPSMPPTPPMPPGRGRRRPARPPDHLHAGDVQRLLRRRGLDDATCRVVVRSGLERGIAPLTLWMWAEQYGVRSLSLVVAAEVSHRELLGHLAAGTTPDLGELEVFARLNGLEPSPARGRVRNLPPPPAGLDPDAVAERREGRRRTRAV